MGASVFPLNKSINTPGVFKGENADSIFSGYKLGQESKQKHKNIRIFNSLRIFKVSKNSGFVESNF